MRRVATRTKAAAVLVAFATAIASAPPVAGETDHDHRGRSAGGDANALRLEHLQMVATHNSYHRRPLVGTAAAAYDHPPLAEQLDAGVRSLELDVHYRGAPELFVYHSDPDDNRSSCLTLSTCLREIASWSDRHPDHHALFVMIEAKTGFNEFPSALGAEQRSRALRDLDAALAAIGRVLTPDHVRGRHDTLRAAVAAGWPTVASTRGRVVFFLLAPDAVDETYLAMHKGLEGAQMFLLANDVSADTAAIASHDDPANDQIPLALAANLLVRTRADADLKVDGPRQTAALASGAHMVATDFPNQLPLKATRCNPVTAPSWCRDGMIETTQPDGVDLPEDDAVVAPVQDPQPDDAAPATVIASVRPVRAPAPGRSDPPPSTTTSSAVPAFDQSEGADAAGGLATTPEVRSASAPPAATSPSSVSALPALVLAALGSSGAAAVLLALARRRARRERRTHLSEASSDGDGSDRERVR